MAKKSRTPSPSQLALLEAEESARGWRETVESIVVAIILALLFRTFEAEAFVIPTGSMAPTLMGDHKDVQCPQCKHWYQAGSAARSVSELGRTTATVCPMCRYIRPIDERERPDDSTFTGDRILVNKFAYEIGDPQRWDVIVFRYPGNAKVNYIKRLIGLPNESLRIRGGDIYARAKGEAEFSICRKPPHKLVAMLQLVHDTNYLASDLVQAKIPSRWSSPVAAAEKWSVSEDGHQFSVAATGQQTAWIRYRNLVPPEWHDGNVPTPEMIVPQLIRDFYAYNATIHERGSEGRGGDQWVGDLALEADVQVESDTGVVLLDLVEGGRHYECKIDVATGEARLNIDGGREAFDNDAGGDQGAKVRIASTPLRGKGSYHLRFANCDDRLYLWVNYGEISFAAPATYRSPPVVSAYSRPANDATGDAGDPGDYEPLGIGSHGAALKVTRLKVWRDIYYTSTEADEVSFRPSGREELTYDLGEDQFMPLGDNSPASSDARLWWAPGYEVYGERREPWREPFVRRHLLTGKAFAVYWPHCWYVPVPYTTSMWPLTPNPSRMQRIK